MSSWLIVVTGLIYTFVAVEQFYHGNPWMGCAYSGYAFANVGLYKMALV